MNVSQRNKYRHQISHYCHLLLLNNATVLRITSVFLEVGSGCYKINIKRERSMIEA